MLVDHRHAGYALDGHIARRGGVERDELVRPRQAGRALGVGCGWREDDEQGCGGEEAGSNGGHGPDRKPGEHKRNVCNPAVAPPCLRCLQCDPNAVRRASSGWRCCCWCRSSSRRRWPSCRSWTGGRWARPSRGRSCARSAATAPPSTRRSRTRTATRRRARAREHAPNLVYEPRTLTLPVDYRRCRAHRCSDAPDDRDLDVADRTRGAAGDRVHARRAPGRPDLHPVLALLPRLAVDLPGLARDPEDARDP